MGYAALYDNTSGTYNTALGYSALQNNTTGSYNTAIGTSSLYTQTATSHNTALGYAAAYLCTSGSTNVSIGNYAAYSSTTSNYNVFIGYQAGYSNTTGSGHTCVGYLAGNNFSAAGSYGNTCIGYNAETGSSTHFNSIVLGYNTAGVGSGYFTFGTGTGNDRVYNQFGATGTPSWARSSELALVKSDPITLITPESTSSSPARTCNKVLLPQPDLPTIATRSLFFNFRLRSVSTSIDRPP